MNTAEGVSRIAKAIRVLGWIPAAFVVWLFFVDSPNSAYEGFQYILSGVVPVAVAYGLAWIIDGFAKPKPPSSSASA